MTPDRDAGAGTARVSSSLRPPLSRLKKRADFLAAARANRAACGGFVLQGRDRQDGEDAVRFGVTASKKVGNAVARNRAKRRLRALARLGLPQGGRPGWDYVLIARAESTGALPFATLAADLDRTLGRIHAATA